VPESHPKIILRKVVDQSEVKIDLLLDNVQSLKTFDNISISLVFYTYDKSLSKEDFKFLPYQEYTEEINLGNRSSYTPIGDFSDKIFGLFLGVSIIILFWFLQPSNLVSIEAIVGIIGAYIAGKELWSDIDKGLQNVTLNWPISWREQEFYYQKQDFGSIQNYLRFSRLKRYSQVFILPSKLDLITQSNSKILEIQFSKKELRAVDSDQLYFGSIEFDSKYSNSIAKGNYAITAKVSQIKNILGVQIASEFIQAIDSNKIGCLDSNKNWSEGKLSQRYTLKIAQLKLYYKNVLKNMFLIETE
jgi:hypothetical protein